MQVGAKDQIFGKGFDMDNRLTYNELCSLASEFAEFMSSKEWKGKAVLDSQNIELVLWLFIDWLWDKCEIKKKESKHSEED